MGQVKREVMRRCGLPLPEDGEPWPFRLVRDSYALQPSVFDEDKAPMPASDDHRGRGCLPTFHIEWMGRAESEAARSISLTMVAADNRECRTGPDEGRLDVSKCLRAFEAVSSLLERWQPAFVLFPTSDPRP